MSVVESLELIDKLVKDKISKRTATDLVDYVEKHQSQDLKKDIVWLKWIVGLGFTVGFGLCFTIMIYFHNNLTNKIDKVESKIDSEMRLVNQKLDRLLRK